MPLFGGPPDVQKLKAKGDIRGLVKALAYLQDTEVQSAAADALAVIGREGPIDGLLQLLRHKDADLRRWAVQALARCKQAWVIEPLAGALRDGDVSVRRSAAAGLGATRNPAALQALVAALRQSDPELRAAAASGLGNLGDRQAVQPLIVALNDWVPRARASAAEALGKLGDRQALDPLTRVAREDMDAHVRACAASALNRVGGLEKEDEQVVRQLLNLLRQWRQMHMYGPVGPEPYEEMSRKIRQIGESVCASGGVERMRLIARRLEQLVLSQELPAELAKLVPRQWEGIGGFGGPQA